MHICQTLHKIDLCKADQPRLRCSVNRKQNVRRHNRQSKLYQAIEVVVQQLEGVASSVIVIFETTPSDFCSSCRPPMYGMVLKPLWWQLVPQAKSFVTTSQLLCKYGCMDTSYQASISSKARLSLYTTVVMCIADKSLVLQTQLCCSPKKLYMFSQAPRKVTTCSCAVRTSSLLPNV